MSRNWERYLFVLAFSAFMFLVGVAVGKFEVWPFPVLNAARDAAVATWTASCGRRRRSSSPASPQGGVTRWEQGATHDGLTFFAYKGEKEIGRCCRHGRQGAAPLAGELRRSLPRRPAAHRTRGSRGGHRHPRLAPLPERRPAGQPGRRRLSVRRRPGHARQGLEDPLDARSQHASQRRRPARWHHRGPLTASSGRRVCRPATTSSSAPATTTRSSSSRRTASSSTPSRSSRRCAGRGTARC